ncbi:MAG: hypothetical protein Kow00120_24440 [Anaerolineae bacterium]
MSVKYDRDSDTLTIFLGMGMGELYNYQARDFTVAFDENDAMVRITIARASAFVAQALAAGVQVEDAPPMPPAKPHGEWIDADSSMISAFRYDAAEEVLEVIFNSGGVYQYYGVTPDVYEGLCDAESKGSFMREFIIDMYRYTKGRRRTRRRAPPP